MTEKLFYREPYMKEFTATVLSCEKTDKGWDVVLDRTAFYPEGGGQPADHGIIGDAEVTDVHEHDEIIVHTCTKEIATGTEVKCGIDWERRFDHMQQHSGEHIVSGMICSKFGCDNTGFHLGKQFIEIDYNADITLDDIQSIESAANKYIWENHEFVEMWPTAEELKDMTYRSKKELTGAVRIASFPGADTCACCGTHVTRSGEVGLVKMLSVQKIKEGTRIILLCGNRALSYLSEVNIQNQKISQELSAKVLETYDAVLKLKEELFKSKGIVSEISEEYFRLLSKEYEDANDPLLITGSMDSDGVRKLCDIIANVAKGCVKVFAGHDGAYKYAIINKGNDISQLVKSMNTALNGRGGGRDGFAQGNAACSAAEIKTFFEE